MVGAMYCIRPMVDSGTRRTANENAISGSAVRAPPKTSSASTPMPQPPLLSNGRNPPCPLLSAHSR